MRQPKLYAMTTTMPDADPTPGPMPTPPRVLRRSRTDRVGAGVAGGLGRYFGFDPVLFRVLFATAAFFGGVGVIAYILAWIAIPEEGAESAAVDRWVDWLRRRRVPVWVVAAGAALLLWLIAFSWWQPHVFWPLIAAVIVLAIALAHQSRQPAPPPQPTQPTAPPTGPVDLTKGATAVPPEASQWRTNAASWIRETHQAQQQRRRRARPVRVATIVALVVTLASLATADAIGGIVLPAYFIVTLAIVGAGLLVGIVLRRTPWTLAVLLIPAVAGIVAFGGTGASLHDGIGSRTWQPTTAPAADYNLALGQGVLDLRHLAPQSGPRVIHVRMAAGQLRILAPSSMDLTLDAHIRFGQLTATPSRFGFMHDIADGAGVDRVLGPPAGATGEPVTIVATLADGQIDLRRS